MSFYLTGLHRIMLEEHDASIRWEQLVWLRANIKNHNYIRDAVAMENGMDWLVAVYLNPDEAIMFKLRFGL